jgi:hypothetical protein
MHHMKKYTAPLAVIAAIAAVGIAASAAHAAPWKAGIGQGRGEGMMKGAGRSAMIEQKASVLGMSSADLQKELASGKTFLQVLQEKGVSQADFEARMQKARTDQIDALLKNGTITQAQHDAMIARMQKNHENAAERIAKGVAGKHVQGKARRGMHR